MTNIRYLQSPSGNRFMINNQSSRQLAQLEGIKGNIGKTSLQELIAGKAKQAKGWQIVEVSPSRILRANKLGVEMIGTGKVRQRKPMKITVSIKPAARSYPAQGDYARFLSAADGKEYSAIAQALGWSRDYVAIYAARAKRLGHCAIQRKSGAIFGNMS